MKTFSKKNIARVAAALLLGLSAASHAVRTDDTEIYLNSGAAFVAPPVVMFYTEYTSRLGAAAGCTVSTTSMVTADLKTALTSSCPTFVPIRDYLVYPDSPGASSINNDFLDGSINRYELIRAVLKRVLIGLGDMEVGVLAVHDDDSAGDACTGPSATNCSNGAYVLNRAVSLENVSDIMRDAGLLDGDGQPLPFDPLNAAHRTAVLAADDNKRALFTKLNGILAPQPSAGLFHKNQDKEVYFELFRYLTGKGVFNGHNGWNDLGTSTLNNGVVHNLGDWYSVNNGGRVDCKTGSTCTSAASNGLYIDGPKPSGSYNGHFNGDFVTAQTVSGVSTYISSLPFKWDGAAESGGTYVSPITDHCQRIFMINVVYGSGNDNNDSDSAITQTFASGGMNRTTIGRDNAGLEQIVSDLHQFDLADGNINPDLEFADRQNVTSFYLADQTSQVDAIAAAGGTTKAIPLTNDPATLITEMNKIFNQILSVSTTYVAASIPVNVFNRSEVIDNAYIALFQADAASKPRWMGDVKKLKLNIRVQTNTDGSTTNKLEFVDAAGVSAIAADGRIDSNAITFWTNGAGYDITSTVNVTGNDPAVVTGKDGRAVTRGGAGQKIPGFLSGNAQGTVSWLNATTGGRKLFTDAISGDPQSGGLMNIEWANRAYLWPLLRVTGDSYSTNALLWPALTGVSYSGTWSTTLGDGAFSPAAACNTYATTTDTATTPTSSQASTCRVRDAVSNLIAYMRGFDVNASLSTTNATNTARQKTRRWLMGDPLHSRPLPINYGTPTGYSASNPINPDIRIIVGDNDGYLRMLKNTGDGTTPAELGSEVWAYMPREVMKIQKQLMDNAIVPDGSTLPKHTYGVDSSPVAFIRDVDGTIRSSDCPTIGGVAQPCDAVWVYAGLRRGGRGYYALDITTPDTPSFKWKITHATAGFGELGYTFSQPVVRFLNWGTGVKPALIFAGGYDTNKDIEGNGTNDTMGRAIYIVDAETGALVWKVVGGGADASYSSADKSIVRSAMTDSIPSEVTAVDGSGDGLVDRIYVGDTGGQVWRVDLPNQTTTSTSDPRTNWKATVLLNLGRHLSGATLPADDRRFFSAPDVVPSKDDSGNFDAIVIGSGNREHPLYTLNTDYMFMYKDRDISSALANDFTSKTPANLADMLNNCGQYDMTSCSSTTLASLGTGWKLRLTDSGEKSLAAAMTLRGVVYFSTYVPPTVINIDGRDASCKPEGKGYFYAINLANAAAVFSYFSNANETATVDLTTEDRKRELASGGIPSENVYVSFRDPENGLTYTGVLPSDLDATDDLGTQQWRSFWYEKKR